MLSSSPGATEVKAEPTVANIPDVAVPSACISFCEKRAEIPPIDVNRFLIPLEASQAAQLKELPESTPSSDSHGSTSSRALVGAADPALTIAFQKLCSTWKLAGFPSAPNAAPFGTSESKFTGGPLVKMNRSREDVEEDLAPYALLSLLTRSVIKALIQGGVDEYRRDEAGVRALGIKHRSRKNVEVKRFLTPSHILRGLASGASPPGDTSLLTVFAPLGMSLPTLGESDVPATGGDP
ncbi:hypothetical protein NM688_g6422 [Phlebia brevispora]|uniref:Uncharacterized protein n=1 Tax=Phlebia brevispora TaxID=194682 RepID=A0ACC1SGD0_9APHY|nr:hypothetical protein NM688_g6422 [Phlebia brevispora]